MTHVKRKSEIFSEVTETGYRAVYPLVVNEKDGSILVQIPAGEFEMGDGENSDCSKHSVYLDTYFIGVYAVTNRHYKVFVDETGHRPPDQADYGNPIWKGNSYPEKYSDHPVVCVSWDDAAAYCQWAGLTLPTEAQWEKAARGPEGFKYPWGDTWDDTLCRNNRDRGSETTAPVYSYPSGVSGYGIYNITGNVWEWCRDWYGSDYYKSGSRKNSTGPSKGSDRVVRGGSWYNVDAGHFRAAYRLYYDPSHRNDDFGFRVALAPGQQKSGR